MSRALLRRCHLCAHRLISPPPPHKPNLPVITPFLHLNFRSFSSSDSKTLTPPPPDTPTPPSSASEITSLADFQKSDPPLVEDVSNAELKKLIEEYDEGGEDVLPRLFDAILRRQLAGKHKDIDDELIKELRMKPLTDVKDCEFDSDLDEALDTDEDIENLCDAREYVQKKMTKDEFFNMDDRKWDEMVREGVEKGFVRDTKECEDMLSLDKLLPGLSMRGEPKGLFEDSVLFDSRINESQQAGGGGSKCSYQGKTQSQSKIHGEIKGQSYKNAGI